MMFVLYSKALQWRTSVARLESIGKAGVAAKGGYGQYRCVM